MERLGRNQRYECHLGIPRLASRGVHLHKRNNTRMQKTLIFTVAIWFVLHILPANTIAQEAIDWHLRHLPNGAKARIG